MHAGYTTALKLARDALSSANPNDMAIMSGASWLADSQYLALSFLGNLFEVGYPQGRVTCDGEDVAQADAIIVLHYLAGATGAALREQWISLRELPGGEVYLESFRQRSVALLLDCFAEDPQHLWAAVDRLGGQRQNNRVTVYALPRIPITLVLWVGDEDVSSDGTVLYDASAPLYLPTEDLIVLADRTIIALKQAGCNRT